MAELLLVAALLAALAAVGRRHYQRSRLRRAAATRAGGTPETAIAVRRFDEIDEHLRARWCHCGGYLERCGEGSREAGGRRYRTARLRCQECDVEAVVFFDTTEVLH
ncbi:MAG TPA: hypothetical protein VNO26_13800 [Candidatus Limnocylindria bacterium]|nr:hypothetical protein [Candidatus Limnocylindria bacterium]